jgi:hypothetical protein
VCVIDGRSKALLPSVKPSKYLYIKEVELINNDRKKLEEMALIEN